MAQQYHPDKNPNGRDMFEKVNTAYEFLCSQSSKGGADGSPDANNIVLILRTQSILFGRYSNVINSFVNGAIMPLFKCVVFSYKVLNVSFSSFRFFTRTNTPATRC